jgi:hypothetical protein
LPTLNQRFASKRGIDFSSHLTLSCAGKASNNLCARSAASDVSLIIASRENNFPLVIIETKYGAFSFHDVYNLLDKSIGRKEVHPYIRYGLVLCGKNKIDNRFSVHNVRLDFAVAMEKIDEIDLQRLNNMIRE